MTAKAISTLIFYGMTSAVTHGAPQFLPSARCALCHSRLEAAEDVALGAVSPAVLWRGSMMAFASRDPYWRAKVRYEAALVPSLAPAIEDKCLRCHAPAQQYGMRGGATGMRLSDLSGIGTEGVTCTACHRILPESLGSRHSLSGAFQVDSRNRVYGPHAHPFEMPMLHHTGYVPVESGHILDPAVCGTCHTVITSILTPKGSSGSEFIEQATYLEWLASDFPASGITCQRCHVPILESEPGVPAQLFIAHRPPGGPFPPTRRRSPFGLHSFVGANFAMLTALTDKYPEEAAVRQNVPRALSSLRSALDLDVSASEGKGGVQVTVSVRNLSGHKLPTGFPSRRLWLHVRVSGVDGSTCFESGAWDASTGDIAGAIQEQPHHSVISRPDQVMIYEALLRDSTGRPTASLLRASQYAKDNRILPKGFDHERELPGGMHARRLAPAGADWDDGFRPGSHTVRYNFVPRPGQKPERVLVEALYQIIAPRHAVSIRQVKHQDIEDFLGIYDHLREPVVIARKVAGVVEGTRLSPRAAE